MWNDPNEKDFYSIQQKFNEYFETREKVRGSGYKQFKRWELFWEPRVYPSGQLFNYSKRVLDTQQKFRQTPAYQNSLRSTNGDWEPLGPTSYSDAWGWNGGVGRINCVAFHPTNSNIIYVGAPAGGLWVTSNGGSTWNCLTADLPLLGVSSVIIHPTAPNTIYILTGDGDAGDTYSIGVLKSANGGVSWSATGLVWDITDKVRGYKMIMHPTNPQIMLIASNDGIIRTTNGWEDWHNERMGDFRDIEFRPTTPDILYAVSSQYLYKSTDTGDYWSVLHASDGLLPTTDFNRIALGVTPASPTSVYLLYGGGSTGFRGFYYSANNADSFIVASNTPNVLGYESDGSDTRHQANYDLALAIDPISPGVVYVGGINVWKSENYGFTWEITSHWHNTGSGIGYTHADIHALEFNGGTLYCGSDGGVFRSTNNADDWTDLSSGLNIMQFYHIDVAGDVLFGGTQDNGCNQWTVGLTTAIHTAGADGFDCIIDYSNPAIRYQSTQSSKYRSNNSGLVFFDITPDTSLNPASYWGADWIMHPTDPNTLFLGSHHKLLRTQDSGNNWTDMNSTLIYDGPVELAQSAANVNVLYISDGTEIKRTTNANGTTITWVNITGNLPSNLAEVTDMVVDPNDAGRIWVTFSGFEGGTKVYYTPNGTGSSFTWYNESGSLPNIPINCIEFEPGSNDGLFIGTDFGVFYKNDDLGDWIFYGNGLPSVIVNDLDIEGTWLYAGTYGQGMWRSEIFTGCLPTLSLTPGSVPYGASDVGTWWHQADQSIISTVIVNGDIGTNVIYRAGDFVRLDPGFEFKAGSNLTVEIQDCGTAVALPVQLIGPIKEKDVEVKLSEKEKAKMRH